MENIYTQTIVWKCLKYTHRVVYYFAATSVDLWRRNQKKFFERKDCDALTKPKEKKEKKDKEEKKEKDKGDNKRPAKNNDHDDAPPKKTKKVKKDKWSTWLAKGHKGLWLVWSWRGVDQIS